jgi:hypothetical protein
VPRCGREIGLGISRAVPNRPVEPILAWQVPTRQAGTDFRDRWRELRGGLKQVPTQKVRSATGNPA